MAPGQAAKIKKKEPVLKRAAQARQRSDVHRGCYPPWRANSGLVGYSVNRRLNLTAGFQEMNRLLFFHKRIKKPFKKCERTSTKEDDSRFRLRSRGGCLRFNVR